MANKKISELPYINGGKLSGNTLVPLVTYFSATTGDTVHTYITDLQNYLTSGITASGNYLPLSGGTVSGGTQFTVGLTANTISATTYQNLPPSTFSGGTVTGPTNFTNGLTATTISATTYQNLPTDVRVTGGTYSAGTITFTNNTGGTFNVTGLTTGSTSTVSGNFLPLSGGTVTGNTVFTQNISVTGGTGINWFSGNTSTDLLRVTQTGTGNAFVVEDSTNPDTTPFIINSAGTTNIGSTNVYTDSSNVAAKLQVSNGVFGGSLSGLVSTTTALIQANTTNSLGLLSPNANTSTLYFGTPSDVYGSIMQWQYTNKRLYFGTQSSNGEIRFTTDNGTERVIFDENGNVGIGTLTPTERLNVSGNVLISANLTATTISATTYQNLPDNVAGKYLPLSGGTVTGSTTFTNGLTANTISATTYQNLPISGLTEGNNINISGSNGNYTISVTGSTSTVSGNFLPLSGGTVTGNTSFTSGLTASTTTINGNLTVTGNTNVRAFTGTTGYISGSGQNILTVIGSGNSTTSPLFSVQGSSGELFSVNDSLVGSLFSVNDISGLPIVEVFSDNTTLWGSYQAPSLNTTTRTSLTAGTNTVYSIPTSAYTGAFIDYTLVSTGTTGARAGNIMTIWSGTTAQYTETSTNDIGTTTGVTFTVAVSGNNAVLSSSATTAGWTLKTIVRSI
jgi:hypothetical protein